MKARSHFDQRSQPAIDANTSFRGRRDVIEKFENRAFPGAILSDDAERFATIDLETYIPQRSEVVPVTPETTA